MKRIVFSLLALCALSATFAQKAPKWDRQKISDLVYKDKKYADAKTYIDQVLSDPKEQSNKEALVWKAVIYAQVATDSTSKSLAPDGLKTANDVLLQLQQTSDTASFNKLMRESGGINAVSNVYSNSFNNGIKDFRASQWTDAYHDFRTTSYWSNYITQNGFSKDQGKGYIDTIPLLYMGFAAQNVAGYDAEKGFANPAMADSAMAIFSQLSDRQLHTPEMVAMYQFMIQYYQIKKDNSNTNKYLSLAKQYYPDKNNIWATMETQGMLSGGNVDDIIKNYQDKQAAGTLTEDQYAQIGSSFASAEKTVKDTAKLAVVNGLAKDAFEKAFALNPNYGIYAFNIGALNFEVFNRLDDEYYANKGESAALKAKRSDIEKRQLQPADSAIYWYEKAYSILSAKTNREPQETNCGNNSIKALAALYQWKMSKAQGHDPQAFSKYEASYNKYSGMFDSLK